MKKNILVLFCLISSIGFVSAQRSIPIKKDNLIVLETYTQSDSANFENFTRFLLDKGYSLEMRDKSLLYMQTDLKTSTNAKGKPSAVRHKLLINFKNMNEIHIRVKVEAPTMAMTVVLVDWEFQEDAIFKESNFFYWQWKYNVKPLLDAYVDKTSVFYYRQ